jgi:hypothetical protein
MPSPHAIRLRAPLAGAALLLAPIFAALLLAAAPALAAPALAAPGDAVVVEPQSRVVAAGDTAVIDFQMQDSGGAALTECHVGRTACDVAAGGRSATATSPIPIDTEPGTVTLNWTASIVVDPVEGPGPPIGGTVALAIVPPRFTVTADPGEGRPGTTSVVSLAPVNPAVQVRECSASFRGGPSVTCAETADGRAATLVVPAGPAGPTEVTWQLTYAGNVRSAGRPAGGSLAFRVIAPAVTTSPPISTPGSPPASNSTTSTSTTSATAPASAATSPSTGALVTTGDDSNAPWALLGLLILPAALLGYLAHRAQKRPRRVPVPTVEGHTGHVRVAAEPVYDRPLYTVRVVGRREAAGPRSTIRTR